MERKVDFEKLDVSIESLKKNAHEVDDVVAFMKDIKEFDIKSQIGDLSDTMGEMYNNFTTLIEENRKMVVKSINDNEKSLNENIETQMLELKNIVMEIDKKNTTNKLEILEEIDEKIKYIDKLINNKYMAVVDSNKLLAEANEKMHKYNFINSTISAIIIIALLIAILVGN